jgi:DNA-3-methyladenine glycosylase
MQLHQQLTKLDAVAAAKFLLGKELIRRIDGKTLSGMIVEAEAYLQNDPASHSFRGQTKRTAIMFGPAVYAYIYFTYGMHYCFNVTAGKEGEGSAVLIRALEPTQGIEQMTKNRHKVTRLQLTNGPAKLCQALAIGPELYGHNLSKPPLQLKLGKAVAANQIINAKRIGISRAVEELKRFYIKDNEYVSQR